MQQTEFMNLVVRGMVRDAALRIVLSDLEDKATSDMPEDLRVASGWYKQLSIEQKALVRVIVRKTIYSTVFRFLCCLDGVKVIDDADGELVLLYKNASTDAILLASSDADNELHELFKDDYPGWVQSDVASGMR